MNIHEFIHQTSWTDLPDAVRSQARRCLLDTVGVAIGGRQTDLSGIINDYVTTAYGGSGAQLWLDGREVSPPGAALANGMTVDSLDMHDGYQLVKGHAGAAVIPAALSILRLDQTEVSGQELLTTLVIGYEVALRAGLALHATACDYHTSGAWNALGCATMAARRLGLDEQQTRHTLGIAEYHGPRSQMMRCIDHPTMLKDGSGWGAMVGVSAALLARSGFTGAPALTLEAPEAAATWRDLGTKWLILEQYFKPYAVCYWAQPAVVGALNLQQRHRIQAEHICRITVSTFHEATRLACRRPQNTEEAQYSLPFPVAAALVYHQLGPREISGPGLADPLVLDLADRVELVENLAFNARFPADRIAQVVLETTAGDIFDSGQVRSPWNTSNPPTEADLRKKFRGLVTTVLPQPRAGALEEAVWHCAELSKASSLLALLTPGLQ